MRPYSPGGMLNALAPTRNPWNGPHIQHPPFTAWTTRVSNPVRSPRFRSSASVTAQRPAFAIGVLPDIYTFHRYTIPVSPTALKPARTRRGSTLSDGLSYPMMNRQRDFFIRNNLDNACTLRITVQLGTQLAGGLSNGQTHRFAPLIKEAYNPKASILMLGMSCTVACLPATFPTAASLQESGLHLSPNVAGRPLRPTRSASRWVVTPPSSLID